MMDLSTNELDEHKFRREKARLLDYLTISPGAPLDETIVDTSVMPTTILRLVTDGVITVQDGPCLEKVLFITRLRSILPPS